MQVTNLSYFYETARKLRGGKWVWVKDSNGESRHNILLGGTILNPSKSFGHLWAGQLLDYEPARGYLIFRSFKVKANAASNATTIYVEGDGYSNVPEVGMFLMIAPDSLKVETFASEADAGTGDITTTKTVSDYSGAYAEVSAVVFDKANERFTVTLKAALGTALTAGDILVEADAAEDAEDDHPTGVAEVLCKNPNNWVEADRELLPTEGFGFESANYSISGVYGKQAWIARMQPLPKYVLELNKSHIPGIFEV